MIDRTDKRAEQQCTPGRDLQSKVCIEVMFTIDTAAGRSTSGQSISAVKSALQ